VAQGREALQNHELRIAPVTAAHLDHAFAQVTPRTTHEEVRRYEEWRVE
jgi:SpoVK/Ycf46/Vps4 family AAA+-type ATPase